MANQPTPLDIKNKAQEVYLAGDYSSAAQAFAEASLSYQNEGDMLMSAEMKNDQSVALLRGKQAQAALEAAQGTEELFAQAGDLRRQGIALANQASALEALKRFQESIEFYTRAGEILEKAGEANMRIEVMQMLASLYLRRLKLFDAIVALQAGLVEVQDPSPKQRLMKILLKTLLFMRL